MKLETIAAIGFTGVLMFSGVSKADTLSYSKISKPAITHEYNSDTKIGTIDCEPCYKIEFLLHEAITLKDVNQAKKSYDRARYLSDSLGQESIPSLKEIFGTRYLQKVDDALENSKDIYCTRAVKLRDEAVVFQTRYNVNLQEEIDVLEQNIIYKVLANSYTSTIRHNLARSKKLKDALNLQSENLKSLIKSLSKNYNEQLPNPPESEDVEIVKKSIKNHVPLVRMIKNPPV